MFNKTYFKPELVLLSNLIQTSPRILSYLIESCRHTAPYRALDIIIISSFQLINACHGILGIRDPSLPQLKISVHSPVTHIIYCVWISNVPIWINKSAKFARIWSWMV